MAGLIDALAYIDTHTDPALKPQIEQLIAEEMHKSENKLDFYLAQLEPEVEVKFSSPSLQEHWEAICENKGQPVSSFDVTRYKIQAPPKADQDDLQAWIQATNNAKSQLEHQKARTVNLELLNRFGAHTWKIHNEQLAAQNKAFEYEIARLNQDSLLVNRKRKADQMGVGPRLEALHDKFYEIARSNVEVDSQNQALRRKIDSLTPTPSTTASSE